MPKENIHYAGALMKLDRVTGNTGPELDSAQAWINMHRANDRKACCTHTGGKTNWYLEVL